jgi:hypothetical protein
MPTDSNGTKVPTWDDHVKVLELLDKLVDATAELNTKLDDLISRVDELEAGVPDPDPDPDPDPVIVYEALSPLDYEPVNDDVHLWDFATGQAVGTDVAEVITIVGKATLPSNEVYLMTAWSFDDAGTTQQPRHTRGFKSGDLRLYVAPEDPDPDPDPDTGFNSDGVKLSAFNVTVDGNTVNATATVETNRDVNFNEVAFAARSSTDANLDFGHLGSTRVNNTTRNLSASRTLQNGTYTVWLAYNIGTRWVDLNEPTSVTVNVSNPPPPDGGGGGSETVAPPPAPGNWTLAWRDEFAGSSIDWNKWSHTSSSQRDGQGNRLQNSQLEWNDARRSENAWVRDGVLTLRATRESTTQNGITYPWRSALITSSPSGGFRFRNNVYIEQRVRLPAAGSGTWPAFWTWQVPGGNQVTEIDVYEYWASWAGRGQQFTAGTHGSGMGGSNQGWANLRATVPTYTGGSTAPMGPWMTFGAHIRSNGVTFYHNGQQVRNISNYPRLDMNIICNLAVWQDIRPPAGLNSISMQIDWVRGWRLQ